MSTKVNELTPKVDRYTVTDPDGQLSATEYNAILDAVQRHETRLDDNDFLRFSEQALDDNDKRQARQNIGAVGEGDYAPKMSVGFADNLIGRGEATAEEFTYRASAGMERSITDDTARVKKIKGNSVVWNQQSQVFPQTLTLSNHGIDATIISGTHYIECSGTTATIEGDSSIYIDSSIYPKPTSVVGHKYLFLVEGCKTLQVSLYKFVSPSVRITNGGTIVTCTANDYIRYSIYIPTSTPAGTTINEKISVLFVDLTQMFTAGNEPTTIEEFYTRIPSGIDINAYKEGEIINLNTEAIKTVGFNQWDEQWELGTLTDVGAVAHNSAIISRNFNKILPSTAYYCAYLSDVGSIGNILQIGFWDMNMVYIGRSYVTNKVITTPANAAYFKVATNTSANITTYNNDICINLSHTGIEDGKYKPYTPFTRELPIIQKYFQNGMRSAGTAFDSIEWDSIKQKWVAVQRIVGIKVSDYLNKSSDGVFTLKNLPYNPATEFGTYSLNVLMVGFDPASRAWDNKSNGMPSVCAAQNMIWLNGDILLQYATAEDYANDLGDTLLYYAIAEPIVTEIEENINFDYYVEDFGTEEALSSVPSAPFRADVVYTFNAVDTIRNNYLAIEEMKKQMAQIQSAISAMQTAQVKVEE